MTTLTHGDLARFDRCPESWITTLRSEEFDPAIKEESALCRVTDNILRLSMQGRFTDAATINISGGDAQTRTQQLMDMGQELL